MTADIFYKELKRILQTMPKVPIHMEYTESCEFGDYLYSSKNLFNSFDCANCTDSTYLADSFMCANCVDCDYAVESELCYESVDPYKCFNCEYLDNCSRLRDCAYSYGCTDCNNIFGCVLLRNKSFCIFNRQLTEDEYRVQIAKYKKLPPEQILAYIEKLKAQYPWTQTNEGNNENTSYGNYIYYNRNCYLCFDAAHNDSCAYMYDSFRSQTCYDSTQSANNQLSYQITDSGNLFNCDYIVYSTYSRDSSYLLSCNDVKNSIGCVGLSHKEYCILNRQLTKEEYEKIAPELLNNLQESRVGWGDLIF